MRRLSSRLIQIAPYLVLGPISGLLLQAIRTNMRDDRPILAGMYGVLLAQYLMLLWWLTARVGAGKL